MQRRGKAWRAQAELAGIFDGKRLAQQVLVRIGAARAHQAQGFAVSADHDVLAIVECYALDFDRARAAAQMPRRFKYGDRNPCQRQHHRRGHAGPAGANDGDVHAVIQVFHAIHSLRTGVNAVRWVSTLQPSASISRSSVR